MSAVDSTYEVVCRNGKSLKTGEGPPRFSFIVQDLGQFDQLLHSDPYTAAMRFVRGDFDVQGDLVAAIEFKSTETRWSPKYWIAGAAARLAPRRIESWFQTESRAARNIRFHYDRSNDFYRLFLDSRMVYSSGYFAHPEQSLEDAQIAKLDHICAMLDLSPGEKFLDIGCGWGGLTLRAAEKFGVEAVGCTLSLEQLAWATKLVEQKGLKERVSIREMHYRNLDGRFDKIASIGMFEHVGRRRLAGYFQKIFDLLEDDGLFLNSGIVRPERVRDAPETLFLQRRVFPGGELEHLSTVIREAETAGFEVLDTENLRLHYALTCRRWVENLQRNRTECLKIVDPQAYRTWLLYLAASAMSFENGSTDIYQMVFAKRGARKRKHLTRGYIYS